MKKKVIALLLAAAMAMSLTACGDTSKTGSTAEETAKQEETTKESENTEKAEESTLVYGSGDYTRINPAMDEHCEINVLLFSGLTAHDADDQVIPGLAEKWEYDEDSYTYTFHIRDGIKWHDGEAFTADDVKFTIEAIMDPENGSENAPNYEDVQEIKVMDDQTSAVKLAEPNVAFLEYMTIAILPKHLLEGEDMQESDFFRHPVGTGPYKLESWDAGQSIVMTKNEDYYLGSPKIDKVIFKIVEDDNTQAVQLQSGEIDMALLDPKNAENFKNMDGYSCYDMTTSDYRGIMFNFANDYWKENKDLIPAICYAIDRQAIIDAVLLGQGMPAYGPLQRNIYNNEKAEHYDYNPEKAKEILAGDIVLSTRATMNGVDKTLLKSGCPTKFNFSWREDGMMILNLSDFSVGAMPFAISFKCATKIMQLNSWEQDEYPGDGWIKFVGTDGNVTTSGDDAEDNQEGSGARVDGYLNVNTNQIEFIVDYNMMNVRTETFLQTIDKTRIDRFKEEFAQYEKDLEEAKKDQGKA